MQWVLFCVIITLFSSVVLPVTIVLLAPTGGRGGPLAGDSRPGRGLEAIMDRRLRLGFPLRCPLDGAEGYTASHCKGCIYLISDGQNRCGHPTWQDPAPRCPVCGEAIPEVWRGNKENRTLVPIGPFCRGDYCYTGIPRQLAFEFIARDMS